MERFDYYSLVRKSDNKEVYTSPDYQFSDVLGPRAIAMISERLKFYFDRVNSGIRKQLENPNLTEEQKKDLKLLDVNDYVIKYVQNKELGCMFQRVYWTKEASDWIKLS